MRFGMRWSMILPVCKRAAPSSSLSRTTGRELPLRQGRAGQLGTGALPAHQVAVDKPGQCKLVVCPQAGGVAKGGTERGSSVAPTIQRIPSAFPTIRVRLTEDRQDR